MTELRKHHYRKSPEDILDSIERYAVNMHLRRLAKIKPESRKTYIDMFVDPKYREELRERIK